MFSNACFWSVYLLSEKFYLNLFFSIGLFIEFWYFFIFSDVGPLPAMWLANIFADYLLIILTMYFFKKANSLLDMSHACHLNYSQSTSRSLQVWSHTGQKVSKTVSQQQNTNRRFSSVAQAVKHLPGKYKTLSLSSFWKNK
jgi:hypothetical protein